MVLHYRYIDKRIENIWSDSNKLMLWQKVELAMIFARHEMGELSRDQYDQIEESLKKNPIDLNWWWKRDGEIHHDLKAFLDERSRFIPEELQEWFHKGMTSYDTEEPAFALMLRQSLEIAKEDFYDLMGIIEQMAKDYRFTIMIGRTHGQEAELQSFGKRCLSWIQGLRFDMETLKRGELGLASSKMSGAIGNYTNIDPELEKKALNNLGFVPYYGATQIVPRTLFVSIACGLFQLVGSLENIMMSIRLGSRSGLRLFQEPFGKKQTGSSAMPHKKNNITGEQQRGMLRMAKSYFMMVIDNISTWEERAIEQSCVERVAWSDLFHVVIRSIKNSRRVLSGLVVYKENMLREIFELKGCYASAPAKEFLKENGFPRSIAYRIVQLAAFNVFPYSRMKREKSYSRADLVALDGFSFSEKELPSIRSIIAQGELSCSEQLDVSEEEVQEWNDLLREFFSDPETLKEWNNLFKPSYLLRNEKVLYKKVLGV